MRAQLDMPGAALRQGGITQGQQGGACPDTPRPGSGRPDSTPGPLGRKNAEQDAVDALLGCHSSGEIDEEEPATPMAAAGMCSTSG